MNELIKENVEGTGDLFPPELIVFLIVAFNKWRRRKFAKTGAISVIDIRINVCARRVNIELLSRARGVEHVAGVARATFIG
jgi:hypothetical protein